MLQPPNATSKVQRAFFGSKLLQKKYIAQNSKPKMEGGEDDPEKVLAPRSGCFC